MTGRRTMITVTAALGVALGSARGSAGEPKERPSGVAGAPASAFALRSPYNGEAEAIGAGRKLYAVHCASCHGERGEGWGNAPSVISDQVRYAAPGALFWFLTNGDLRRGMPAWSRLTEARRWQLVTFLRSDLFKPGGASGAPPRPPARVLRGVEVNSPPLISGSAYAAPGE